MMEPLLRVRELRKAYKVKKGFLKSRLFEAVRGVSLDINRGEILGLVGESGSGKSTIGKMILRLERPDGGSITFEGKNIWDIGKRYSREVSVVFQDPGGSLNPRMKVREILEEPLIVHGIREREERVRSALNTARLSEEFLDKKPDQLSGGQRQRVAIARALVLEPKLIIADEPTASLDASIRSEIADLFLSLKEKGISTLFITHDIRMVERIADRIAVLYGGVLMEYGKTSEVLKSPLSPYTVFLLGNLPVRHPRERKEEPFEELQGEPREEGCPFYERCDRHSDACLGDLRRVEVNGRIVTCTLY